VRCRAGTLRGRRPLRGVYTGFALGLPMVGNEISLLATNGSLDPKGITNHEVIATRAGVPGRQAIPLLPKNCVHIFCPIDLSPSARFMLDA
jgi:hypothetical protein